MAVNQILTVVPGRHTVRRSVVGAQGASGEFNWGGGEGGGV